MSAFNGAGTFVISGVGLPFVTGTTISSTVANQLNADLATGLSTCITKDGQTVPVANIPMGNFKLTGLAAPTAPGDALSWGRPATVGTFTCDGLTVNSTALIGGNTTINGSLAVNGVPGITCGTLLAAGAGSSALSTRSFGFQADFTMNQIATAYGGGFDMICISNGVRLNNGATSWAAISEKATKKDLTPIPGIALDIVAAHEVKLGRYLTDDPAVPLRPFLFYDDAILHYPWATSTQAASTIEYDFTDPVTGVVTHQTRNNPEFKGLSLEQYVPLLVKALQEQIAVNASLDARLAAGGL